MKRRAKKRENRQVMPVMIVCILILILAIVGLGTHFIRKYIPTKERMDLTEYYGQPVEGEMAVVLGSSIMEEHALKSGDQVYLPLDMVNTYLNQRYYWDSNDQQILYATPSELQYYPASESGDGDVWLKDGNVYLRLAFVQKFTDLDVYIYENPNRIAIQYQFTGVNATTVKKDTSIRYQGGIKSPILTDINAGDTLIYLEELEDWAKVATMDGYIGYVQKDKISAAESKDFEKSFEEKEQYTYLTMDGKVNMSWHQVTSQDANAYLADTIANISGVNVISPTWYYIQDTSGNIGNIASADYVTLAHERGLKVWGLIDNFTAEVSTTETLSQLASRQNMIQQLIQSATEVGLDGINVDFETLSEDAGPHFLEFLRELSIECHKNNLVLSVDNPVPEDFTSHYDRKEQGLVVDYIVIMGYDEHYVGSDAGSVASLPWVEQGVQDTIAETPAERTILAIPFYTRLWKTTGGALTSEAIGMDEAQNVLTENGVEPVWDGSVSQNYATFEKDNSTYQIWMEDAQSIAEKVKLIPKYNLGGVAQWKLGFENSSIWQTISENLQ
ncbi:glycosyl hydrolase family 18 protein [Blautia sp. MSJ-19]|uniref:glycosyl hydrolase family 18 protein n=1 Tax=Blautia sp. MSJ-19 TaxID=2841517 RepID=UPI001C0EA2B8|nr:glycosyl hydrolase family 18 protein [Blautia sp. MSJ-19]MBU5479618.1 SH3 domain-containing protein [Blautia sp. MSJ-19]